MENERPSTDSITTEKLSIFRNFGLCAAPSKPDDRFTDEEWNAFVTKMNALVWPYELLDYGIFLCCFVVIYTVPHHSRLVEFQGEPFSGQIGLEFLKVFALIAIICILLISVGSRVVHYFLYKNVRQTVDEIETMNPYCHVEIWTEPSKIAFLYGERIFIRVERRESVDPEMAKSN